MLSSADMEKILSEEIFENKDGEILLFKNMDEWNAVAALLGGGGIRQVICQSFYSCRCWV